MEFGLARSLASDPLACLHDVLPPEGFLRPPPVLGRMRHLHFPFSLHPGFAADFLRCLLFPLLYLLPLPSSQTRRITSPLSVELTLSSRMRPASFQTAAR